MKKINNYSEYYVLLKSMEEEFILSNYYVSEDILSEIINKDNAKYIFEFQIVSEKFIEKNMEFAEWELISTFQKLSDKFVIKYINELTSSAIYNNNLKEKTVKIFYKNHEIFVNFVPYVSEKFSSKKDLSKYDFPNKKSKIEKYLLVFYKQIKFLKEIPEKIYFGNKGIYIKNFISHNIKELK